MAGINRALLRDFALTNRRLISMDDAIRTSELALVYLDFCFFYDLPPSRLFRFDEGRKFLRRIAN